MARSAGHRALAVPLLWALMTPCHCVKAGPPSAAAAKAAHEIDDQPNDKDQSQRASPEDGAAKIKTPAAKQKQEHKQYNDDVHGMQSGLCA